MNCLAPKCPTKAEVGALFCRLHLSAPAAQRGGWMSAAKRARTLDASNVATRLWVGSKPPLDRHLPGFDSLVLCAAELQPERTGFTGKIARCPLPDGPLDTRQLQRALITAHAIAIDLRAGKRVLVTCAMGLNRSAFVAALALARNHRITAPQLVELMRARRSPHALGSAHFRGYLERFVRTT